MSIDSTLFGARPWGFHLTNFLLHTANVVLLFLVLNHMTGALWRSALVAALFAVHPLRAESVTWVSERKDVLSTFFGLLALAAYFGYVKRPGVGRYGLVALAFALSLLAKPMLVTLPCVLLLLDYWPLGRLATSPLPSGGEGAGVRGKLPKLDDRARFGSIVTDAQVLKRNLASGSTPAGLPGR